MILWRWTKAFLRFWYGYIFGDDWTVAAIIGVGLLVTWRLDQAGVAAWWPLPPVVLLATVQSLGRAVRRERA
jgi:hypothetical protein